MDLLYRGFRKVNVTLKARLLIYSNSLARTSTTRIPGYKIVSQIPLKIVISRFYCINKTNTFNFVQLSSKKTIAMLRKLKKTLLFFYYLNAFNY